MRLVLCLMLLAACEKASGVETTGGSSSTPREAPVTPNKPRPNAVATTPDRHQDPPPIDAGVVAIDAAVVAVAPKPPKPYKPSAADEAEVRQRQADAQHFADLLTAEGPNTRNDVDMGRRPGADLGRQIQDVRVGTGGVAVGGGTGRRGNGDPRVGMGSGPTIDTPANQPSGPSGRVAVSSKSSKDNSTLTPDLVLQKIQSVYMAGIKRCYKNYLLKEPSWRGSGSLGFTVTETGRATSPRAPGFAQEISDCVTAQISAWRFPIPKDKDGESTSASFEIGLSLVPD